MVEQDTVNNESDDVYPIRRVLNYDSSLPLSYF